MSKKWSWAIIAVLVLAVIAAGFYLNQKYNKDLWSNTKPSVSPSGSALPAGWKMYDDGRFSYAYPQKFDAKYASAVDWPPTFQITGEKYVCTSAGLEDSRAGQTVEKTINGRKYCVTTETEGAAGSIYSMYAYATARGNQTLIFNFSLKYPQCGNYPEPQMTECTNERTNFNIDPVIDEVMQSFKMK